MRRAAILLTWATAIAGVVLATIVGVRIYDAVTGPPLASWHRFVPDEASAAELDAMDWPSWLAREEAVFAEVRDNVTRKLAPEDEVPSNRYFAGSPIHTPKLATDWNRSFVLMPEGAPKGAAVLIHGLTDAPYSLRHVAERFRAEGFVAIAVRMPGHGTVPAGLTRATWAQWLAATRLGVREAERIAGAEVPLHLVGYSNGGALVMKYALDALEDEALAPVERLVLLSPMIGITGFARFAGIAGWPAILPRFAHAAWFSIIPEFNPFKYNSFPVNAAVQSHRLTVALQRQINRLAREERLDALAPVLTFQSVVDATVSTPALVTALYDRLPANGSELVMFDINRASKVGPLIRRASETILERILPAPPRAYRTTVIVNAAPDSPQVAEVSLGPGSVESVMRPLDARFPEGVYSLSHVAIPFPLHDGLYGLDPDPRDDVGVNLGTISTRGELGVLIVGLDFFARMFSNPFYDYLDERLAAAITAPPG